jgi:hypothetical protein
VDDPEGGTPIRWPGCRASGRAGAWPRTAELYRYSIEAQVTGGFAQEDMVAAFRSSRRGPRK